MRVSGIIFMPNQLNNAKSVISLWEYYVFLCLLNEFDKNANSVSVGTRDSFPQSWFGDYRSLRFMCGYFGSRTFLFSQTKQTGGKENVNKRTTKCIR